MNIPKYRFGLRAKATAHSRERPSWPAPTTIWPSSIAEVLGYTPEPRNCSYRPSVDVFFESIVRYWQGEVIGILLSGMGRDGAQGLKRLRDAGAITIAQDSATCAVYGMPKAAAELKAASTILPVERIAGVLANLIAGPSIEEET